MTLSITELLLLVHVKNRYTVARKNEHELDLFYLITQVFDYLHFVIVLSLLNL